MIMSNTPYPLENYNPVDLKLGIKSSLPNVKATLSLSILLWESDPTDSTISYSISSPSGKKLSISPSVKNKLNAFIAPYLTKYSIDINRFFDLVEANQLFLSQIEALKVGFELIWRLAEVTFLDSSKPFNAERTGGVRFPKKLSYTSNIDIIHAVITGNPEEYIKILLSWLGLNVSCNSKFEINLESVFTIMSEGAVFKMSDGEKNVVFNENGIYKRLLDTQKPVDVTGTDESKGPLRILRSYLSECLNPHVSYDGRSVSVAGSVDNLAAYQERVSTFLKLSTIDYSTLLDRANGSGISTVEESKRIKGGQNIILYGVPGSGKSYAIKHQYCDDETKMVRVVFHPDYTYSDFVGQILPVISGENDEGEGRIIYKFVPGPFTQILKKAYENPESMFFLVIEEINRGNAPAIFGDIFQLLDRSVAGKNTGESEYGITNSDIAEIAYGDPYHMVKIPSNLSIICTMNTSDQNVFTLDTAFQRRWNMRLVPNKFSDSDLKFSETKILDTRVSWKTFCERINDIILTKNVRLTSSEDKRLGTHFVTESDLKNIEPSDLHGKELSDAVLSNRKFPEKVIKYLWDDAFKFNREEIFDINKFNSLESVIDKFVSCHGNDRFLIFVETVRNDLLSGDDSDSKE